MKAGSDFCLAAVLFFIEDDMVSRMPCESASSSPASSLPSFCSGEAALDTGSLMPVPGASVFSEASVVAAYPSTLVNPQGDSEF